MHPYFQQYLQPFVSFECVLLFASFHPLCEKFLEIIAHSPVHVITDKKVHEILNTNPDIKKALFKETADQTVFYKDIDKEESSDDDDNSKENEDDDIDDKVDNNDNSDEKEYDEQEKRTKRRSRSLVSVRYDSDYDGV